MANHWVYDNNWSLHNELSPLIKNPFWKNFIGKKLRSQNKQKPFFIKSPVNVNYAARYWFLVWKIEIGAKLVCNWLVKCLLLNCLLHTYVALDTNPNKNRCCVLDANHAMYLVSKFSSNYVTFISVINLKWTHVSITKIEKNTFRKQGINN